MIGQISDIGNYRSINEDYVGYLCDEKFSLFVVADGMGGHNAGEVASKMAVEGIISFVKENYGIIPYETLLNDAIIDVNYKIFKYSLSHSGLNGMGTTVVAAILVGEDLQIANVGDSCCFALGESEIIKITKDHSLVQELLDSGSITEEEARVHPRKNIITRAVGTNIKTEVDIYNIPFSKYKHYVLCSDGLTNDITDEEILKEVSRSINYQETCKSLVSIAKERGGKDNITVLIFGGESK